MNSEKPHLTNSIDDILSIADDLIKTEHTESYNLLASIYQDKNMYEDFENITKIQIEKGLINQQSYSILLNYAIKTQNDELIKQRLEESYNKKLLNLNQCKETLHYFHEKKDYDSMTFISDLAINSNNADHELYYFLAGSEAFKNKDLKKTQIIIEQAKEKEIMGSLMYDLLVRVKLVNEEYENAKNIVEEVIKQKKATPHVYEIGIFLNKNNIPLVEEIYRASQENKSTNEKIKKSYLMALAKNSFQRLEKEKIEIKTEDYYEKIMDLDIQKDFSNLIKLAEEAEKKNKTNAKIVLLQSGALYKLKSIDEAINVCERAIKNGIKSVDLMNSLSIFYQENKRNDDSLKILEELIKTGIANNATYTIALNIDKKEEYLEALERISENKEKKIETLFMLAMKTELPYKGKDKTHYFKKIAEEMQKEKELEKTLKKEFKATHTLNTLEEDFNKQLIIKTSSESFDEEIRLKNEVSQIINSGDQFLMEYINFPTTISHLKKEGKYHYVMTYEKGITLTDLIHGEFPPMKSYYTFNIKEHDLTMINAIIISGLAKLYVKMPGKDLEDYDFREKLASKGYEKIIQESMDPFMWVLEQSKNKSYYPDLWTDNIIISSDNIIFLDTENRGKAPAAMTLAQTLGYIPSDSFKNTLPAIQYFKARTTKYMQENQKNTPLEHFNMEYTISSIYRSLLNLKNIGETDKKYINSWKVANFGIEAIDFLKEAIPDYTNALKSELTIINDFFHTKKEEMKQLGREKLFLDLEEKYKKNAPEEEMKEYLWELWLNGKNRRTIRTEVITKIIDKIEDGEIQV